jgi:hypothetical protein
VSPPKRNRVVPPAALDVPPRLRRPAPSMPLPVAPDRSRASLGPNPQPHRDSHPRGPQRTLAVLSRRGSALLRHAPRRSRRRPGLRPMPHARRSPHNQTPRQPTARCQAPPVARADLDRVRRPCRRMRQWPNASSRLSLAGRVGLGRGWRLCRWML